MEDAPLGPQREAGDITANMDPWSAESFPLSNHILELHLHENMYRHNDDLERHALDYNLGESRPATHTGSR